MIEALETRLWAHAFHCCAVCLRPVDRVIIGARVVGGTTVRVVCHARWMRAVVTDLHLEDHVRHFWFDGDEGKPIETPAMKRRKELAEDLERQRAERARQGAD